MKTEHRPVRTPWPAVMLAAAVALTGCSALQIDVDVYKGSLSHEKDIQTRQFSALAMAAKPVLARLRNEMHDKSQHKTNPASSNTNDTQSTEQKSQSETSAPQALLALQQARDSFNKEQASICTNWSGRTASTDIRADERSKYSAWTVFDDQQAAYYLNGLLSFYEPRKCVSNADDWHRARGDDGLIQLFNYLQQADAEVEPQPRAKAQAEGLRKLKTELIPFAERVLFAVNNRSLFGDDDYRPERALLQSLGNSIILHANDLARREQHEATQQQRFDPQRRAAEAVTAAQAPAAVLAGAMEQINLARQKADQALLTAKAVEQAAGAAAANATEAVTKAEKDTSAAKASLEKWKPANAHIERARTTLVEPARSSSLDVPAAEQDLAALQTRMAKLKPEGTVSAREVANDILAWATAERKPVQASSERQKRIAAVLRVLDTSEPSVSLAGIPAAPAPAVFAALQAAVQATLLQNFLPQHGLQQQADSADLSLAKARADLAARQAVLSAASSRARAAATAATSATAAAQKVAGAVPKALLALEPDRKQHPEAVRQALLNQLQGSDATETAALDTARSAVRAALLPSGFSFDSGRFSTIDALKAPATSMQVLDDWITHLRTERADALRRGDPGLAQQLADAVEAAEQQRSDQVFLRPSSEYLRNVYAGTALQNSSKPVERNMLWDYLRSLRPRSSRTKDDVSAAREDLEKLFWQPINQVTTAGGSNANYVVAKDDVGNWGIKAYSTDPQQVFESAKGLALFNKGARLDTNLLKRATLGDTLRNADTKEKRDAAKAELDKMEERAPAALAFGGRAQERHALRYQQDSSEAANALKAHLMELNTKVLVPIWTPAFKTADANEKTQLDQLEAAAEKLQDQTLTSSLLALETALKSVTAGTDPAPKVGTALVNLLHAVLRHREALHELLASNAFLSEPSRKESQKQLQGNTRKRLTALVEEVASQRRRSVETYSEGLEAIGDVLK